MGRLWTRCVHRDVITVHSDILMRIMLHTKLIFFREQKSLMSPNFYLSKVEMFAQRYALIQQRILRQDIFQPKLVTATTSRRHGRGYDGGENITLTPVESLLGRSGRRFLLGMIVQVRSKSRYLCCKNFLIH